MTRGERLLRARADKQLSLEEAADAAQMNKETLSRLERNETRRPQIGTLRKLEKLYKIDLSRLDNSVGLNTEQLSATVVTPPPSSTVFRESEPLPVLRFTTRGWSTAARLAHVLGVLHDQEEQVCSAVEHALDGFKKTGAKAPKTGRHSGGGR